MIKLSINKKSKYKKEQNDTSRVNNHLENRMKKGELSKNMPITNAQKTIVLNMF